MPPSNSPVFSLALLTPCSSHLKSVVSVEADISRLAVSGLAVRNPIPLNTAALKHFIPLVRLSRQSVRACPVLQGKGLVSLSMEGAHCRGRCWVIRCDSAVVAVLFKPHSAWEVAKQEVSHKLLSLLHTGYCLVTL